MRGSVPEKAWYERKLYPQTAVASSVFGSGTPRVFGCTRVGEKAQTQSELAV